jgi:hypothetical protein
VKRRGVKRTSEGTQALAPSLAQLRGVAQQAASVPVQHQDEEDGAVEGRMDVVDDAEQKVRLSLFVETASLELHSRLTSSDCTSRIRLVPPWIQ